jgi:3'-phosphoadenosine 5'-phosphosulfate sulfotransferase (PAPS reductase)/FAD synthetase
VIRIFSYGGGVQSTAALVLAARRVIDFPVFVFSNVGDDSENPDTINFVNEVAKPYAAENGIEFVELGGKQTLLESLYRRERSVHIPVRMNNGAPGRRGCTTDYKVRRIARFTRQRGATESTPTVVGMGISTDEFHRMRTSSGIPWQTLAYPLIDLRLSRSDCAQLIADAGLPVPPKSSCWFCPMKRKADWQELHDTKPLLFAASVELEKMLNVRREKLGRDPVWLSNTRRPLDEAIGNERQLPSESDPGCEAGYCMV